MLDKCDALVVLTDWPEFRTPDFEAIRSRLRHPVVFDGRNLYDPESVESGRTGVLRGGPAGAARRDVQSAAAAATSRTPAEIEIVIMFACPAGR